MPYRLATPPYSFARNSVTLKITRCVRSASQGYMGWVKGLEPSTLGTTIRCSNQLSYTHHIHVMTAIAVFVVRAINGRDGWIRTSECRRQRPMPYRLATPPYSFARNSVTLKITRCVRSASQGYMGWVKGLEPSTLGTTIRCSNQLSYTHHIKFAADGNGTPGGIRTPGLLLRRQLLYPAELLAHINSDKPIRRKWSG